MLTQTEVMLLCTSCEREQTARNRADDDVTATQVGWIQAERGRLMIVELCLSVHEEKTRAELGITFILILLLNSNSQVSFENELKERKHLY